MVSMRTDSDPKRSRTHSGISDGLFLLAIISLLVITAQACEGTSDRDGALGLVPDDASHVNVHDVQLILSEAPDGLKDPFEDDLEDSLDRDYGISIEDVETLVNAWLDGERLDVLAGNFDFERIRDELDDNDYDDDQYAGHEIWEKENEFANVHSVALLEIGRQVLIGSDDTVRNVLKVLNRGSGFLLDNADNDVVRALNKAGLGWETVGREDCRIPEVRGCQALGISKGWGEEDDLVEVTYAYLFRNERTAESEMDDIEDFLDDELQRRMDIEDVRVDGEFVVVTITFDEDDWPSWLP